MRLQILQKGHRLRVRLFMSMVARLSGSKTADIVKVLLYRPEFFGRAMTDLSAEMMRGPSFWTAGEREYIGMFTAQLHQCPFCIQTHTELVRIASDGKIDPLRPDSLRPEVTAVLKLLEGVTHLKGPINSHDLERVRNLGVPEEAIAGALYVNFVWNVVNRLANAFGFELHEDQLLKGAQALHRFGYRFPSFLIGRSNRAVLPGQRTNWYAVLAENLKEALLGPSAQLDQATRLAATNGESLPMPWGPYSAKLREKSYGISQADIDELTKHGHSEDEVFEMTVCTAVAAATDSLQAGLQALQGTAKSLRR